jgi:hypothetical protein
MHSMIAAFTGNPVFQLDQKEARILAEGIAAVQAQYPNVLLSDKQQAWSMLCVACATVYGPRLFLLKSQASAKKNASKTAPPQPNVVRMPL